VLCGTDARRREAYRGHIEATERRFYEERDGGVRDLVEWYARHARARWRLPPFVLSVDNAAAYFDPSTAIRNTRKRSASMLFRGLAVRARLAQVLRDHADARHRAA